MIFSSVKPIYEVVADYFRKMIHHGAFKPGDALPSVREVAYQEKINPNTVSRAYGILVNEGLVTALPKKGYFVSSQLNNDSSLRLLLSSLLEQGHSKEEIISCLDSIKEGDHD